jgi:hypothetical protein
MSRTARPWPDINTTTARRSLTGSFAVRLIRCSCRPSSTDNGRTNTSGQRATTTSHTSGWKATRPSHVRGAMTRSTIRAAPLARRDGHFPTCRGSRRWCRPGTGDLSSPNARCVRLASKSPTRTTSVLPSHQSLDEPGGCDGLQFALMPVVELKTSSWCITRKGPSGGGAKTSATTVPPTGTGGPRCHVLVHLVDCTEGPATGQRGADPLGGSPRIAPRGTRGRADRSHRRGFGCAPPPERRRCPADEDAAPPLPHDGSSGGRCLRVVVSRHRRWVTP